MTTIEDTTEKDGAPLNAGGPEWVSWPVSIGAASDHDESAISESRIRVLQLVLLFSAVALLIMVVRSVIRGGVFPVADLSNALVFVVLLYLLKKRPDWHAAIAWVGLLGFSVNTVDGLFPLQSTPIVPTHVLIPFMVLYGALIGNLWMSVAAAVEVVGIYAFTGWLYWPLSDSDFLILTNLCLATVCAGVAAFGAWMRNRRLLEKLSVQGEDLRRELDTRLRLNAIIFHDIRTPLTGLLGAVDMASAKDQPEPEDLDAIRQMSERIEAIVKSTRDMEASAEISWSNVSVRALWEQLDGVFSSRLAAKEQQLVLTGGEDLEVRTNASILCNSVLGNLVNNAIKFSPRGSKIEMSAGVEIDSIRVEIRDHGNGFPDDVLTQGPKGQRYKSHAGTDGETGSAYGLRITALCAHRLRGLLQVRNYPGRGASVAVVLPRA
ncbi:MAG: hypothetical protein C0404_12835 [Verrucomicrobia bacterium]|nr:hypothetical protein [Verrucomicrobiota bacterium]